MKLTYRLFFIWTILFSIPSFGDYWLRSDNARDQVKMEEGQVCYVVDTEDKDIFFGTVNSDKRCAGDWHKQDQPVETVVFEEDFSFQPRDYEKLERLNNEIRKNKTYPLSELDFLELSDSEYLDRKYGELWNEIKESRIANYEMTIKSDDPDLTLEISQVVRTKYQGKYRKSAHEVVSVKYKRQVDEDEPEEDASMDLGDRRVIDEYVFIKVKSAWVKRGPNYKKVDLKVGIMDPFSGSVTNLGGLLGGGSEDKFFKEFISQHKEKGITKGAFDHRGKGAFGDEHDFGDTARGKNKAWRMSKKKYNK